MWDERYSQTGYVYGTQPNDFLRIAAVQIPSGPVLSLGEGEGRNAVYLAQFGHEVLAVDQSPVGLAKAQRLATEQGTNIETFCGDLGHYEIVPGSWAGIVSIFCHLPSHVRKKLYASVVNGLRPDGVFALEAYTPEQLSRGTGGPQDPDMLVSLAELTQELTGLRLIHGCELEREVCEGSYHTGRACVVQVIGVRC